MKIDLVVPAGRHSWNLGEGWARTLQSLGLGGRVFEAGKRSADELLRYARAPQADLMLLLGADHHMPFLHDTPAKRDAWRSSRVPAVAFCFESILDTRFEGSIEKSLSAAQAFSHFLVCDEKDERFFAELGAPVEWAPQCVDPGMFRPGDGPRRKAVFFRGKADLAMFYRERVRLLERLRALPEFQFVTEEISDEALARSYQEHAAVLNPPGVFGGYNVRAFEALASGCILLQSRIAERPRNEKLFGPEHLILFDPADLDAAAALVRDVAREPGRYESLARAGREECLAHHTIEHRVRQVVAFVERSWQRSPQLQIGCGDNLLSGFVNTDSRAMDPRVVVQDASRLPKVEDGSVALAYACHILEHFPRSGVVDVLRQWRRKLRPGGRIYLSVPDARYLALMYVGGATLADVLPPLFGGQEYPGNFHHTAFDRRLLGALLTEAGFADVEPFDPRSLWFTRYDCSRWPLSLNLTAVNPPAPARPGLPQQLRRWLKTLAITFARYARALRGRHFRPL